MAGPVCGLRSRQCLRNADRASAMTSWAAASMRHDNDGPSSVGGRQASCAGEGAFPPQDSSLATARAGAGARDREKERTASGSAAALSSTRTNESVIAA